MKEGKEAKRYHKVKNLFFYFGLALDFFLLVVLQLSGLSVYLRSFSSEVLPSSYGTNFIYILIFCVGMHAIHFPLKYFLEFIWEHKFKLSNQTFLSWLKDDAKKFALSFILMVVLLEIVYMLLGNFQDSWWIWAGFAWLFLSLLVARILPNFIIPIFFKYSEVGNEELKKTVFGLFSKCNVNLDNVYSIDLSSKTKKANAFICGLGKSRRVVVSDTLLNNFSNDEIVSVVAHELGHYKNKDIVKLISVNTVIIFLSFFVIDKVLNYSLVELGGLEISDIAAFPVFALTMMMLGLVASPFASAFSRRLETAADRFSLTLTKNKDAFISMMEKLCEMNLAEVNPGRFNELMFYDHPPIKKRIKFAENFIITDA